MKKTKVKGHSRSVKGKGNAVVKSHTRKVAAGGAGVPAVKFADQVPDGDDKFAAMAKKAGSKSAMGKKLRKHGKKLKGLEKKVDGLMKSHKEMSKAINNKLKVQPALP